MLPLVVVGVDGSAQSLAAAEWAAREAERRGRPLRSAHAWNWHPRQGEGEPANAAQRSLGRRVLREAEDRVRAAVHEVRLRDEQVEGPATEALLGEVERAEPLVLGSRGLSGLAGYLVGSVALGVVAKATRPVVLVRAGETAEASHTTDATTIAESRHGGRPGGTSSAHASAPTPQRRENGRETEQDRLPDDHGGRPRRVRHPLQGGGATAGRPKRRFRFSGPTRGARRQASKAHAGTAGRLMTRPPVTAHPDDTIVEAARTMARRRVERLPVVDDGGRLVSIVTRSDLLQVFLRPDRDIRQEVIEEVLVRFVVAGAAVRRRLRGGRRRHTRRPYGAQERDGDRRLHDPKDRRCGRGRRPAHPPAGRLPSPAR